MKVQNRRIYSFDSFQLDVANRRLLNDDKPISLSAKAFDLLHTLLENRGRLVEKDELFNSVWRDQIVEESNLTVHISQIRKALGENKNDPRYIETVPGYGYRFVGDVSDTDDEEFVIETQTLSRITVEKEERTQSSDQAAGTIEARRVRSLPTDAPIVSRLSSFQKALAAAAIVVMAGSLLWFAGRFINSTATGRRGDSEQLQIKRLTNKGTVAHAVLSPDGKFFAYTLREKETRRDSLWLGQTSGEGDVQLRPSGDAAYNPRAFSADGHWLYYTESEPRQLTGTLYKVPVLGGVPQKMLSGISTYAVLSQDERLVAYIREGGRGESSALVVSNLDGTEEREIAVRQGEQSFSLLSLAWSPDGSFIAFSAGSGKAGEYEIFAANVANGDVKQLTTLRLVSVHSLKWRTEGGGLIGIVSDKDTMAATQIWGIDVESGKAQRITNDLQTYGISIGLSADSTALLAVQTTKESTIWIAPADDLAAARQITYAPAGLDGWYGADWTPDGKIVYSSRLGQSLTLWKTDADGKNAEQITSTGFMDNSPTMTGDGKYVVFSSDRSGYMEVWRMNPDGSDMRQLTSDGGHNLLPHASPDGTAVIYTHYAEDKYSIWRVSIDGGTPAQITEFEFFYARISPDGNFFACGLRQDGKTKLGIVPISGGPPTQTFELPPTHNLRDSIRWSNDGSFISYKHSTTGLWKQNLSGGTPERLDGLIAEKLFQHSWSPDGKQLAYTRGREISDTVLITNFK